MLSTGEIIDGKYRIVRLLGEGGMGAVYEGENTRIHRKVAIKILHAGVAEQSEAVARFEREAQAAGRIGSEHIVEVLDLGTLANGERYLVMEFLEGESLSGRIRSRGRLTPQELSPIAYQLLEGLAAAHAAGIIHRDLKPDNVWLLKTKSSKAEFVKLLDFGISKFNQLSGDSGFSMTRTGAVMGTPYYMAPEQAKGARDMDHRVDLYATGVILYEALTGQVPFNADTFNELLFKIVLEQPRPVEELVPEIDAGFSAIVNKAMARDPASRFANAQDFQAALSQWASGYGPQLVASLAVQPTTTGGIPTGLPGGYGPPPGNTASDAHFNPATSPGVNPNTPGIGLNTGTPGTWSQSGNYAGASAPKQNHTGLFVVLGVVGLLVLGGGGYAALSFTRSSEAAASEAQKQAELASQEREAAAQKAAAAQAEAEKAKTAQAEAEAKKNLVEADRAKIEAEKEALAKAAASASAAAAAAATAPARPRVAAAPPVKAKTPAPEPAKEPAKTSSSSTTTSSGRKIRTSL